MLAFGVQKSHKDQQSVNRNLERETDREIERRREKGREKERRNRKLGWWGGGRRDKERDR